MFKVPESILNNLKCYLCDGYLNASPVVVKDGMQICAKCYKILPQNEKELCVRQVSFEALGNCLIFPCRYHQMGCDHTFTWDNENEHESGCKKRCFTVPDVVVATNKDKAGSNILSPTQIEHPEYETLIPKRGKTNKAFSDDFNVDNENLINSIELSTIKGPLNNEEQNNNSLLYENIYSSIPSRTVRYCLNCNAEVDKSTKSVCLFGHISCNNCKSDMCIACVKNLDGNSRIACKNASKGCQELLYQGDVGLHRDNCEFNEIACPFDKCDKKHALQQLADHLKEEHPNEVILSNEIKKNLRQKDQTLVFLCHDGIFKCLYYHYITSVEIFVVYLGPCKKATEYHFEVTVQVNKKSIKKKMQCANWNNYMLASGVSFDKKEFLIDIDKPLKFELNLKIIHANLS